MSFFERYAAYCKLRGIAPVSQAAADAIGCNKSTISAISKNQNTPKGDFVAKAARMLDVSADYLLEISDMPYPLHVERTFQSDEIELVQSYRKLNESGKAAVRAAMSGLRHSNDFMGED